MRVAKDAVLIRLGETRCPASDLFKMCIKQLKEASGYRWKRCYPYSVFAHAFAHAFYRVSASFEEQNHRYQKPVVDRCFLPAHSEAGEGLPFSCRGESSKEDPLRCAPDKGSADGRELSQRRVLIVDDNEDSLAIACHVLEEAGYHVFGIVSGHDAVEATVSYQPNLVVLDLVLDGISGIDVFREIKQYEQFSQMPIIATTALAQKSIEYEAIAIGFSDYLLKPYHIEDLRQLVEKRCSKAIDLVINKAIASTVSSADD